MDIDESVDVMDESVNAYGSVVIPDENAERSVDTEDQETAEVSCSCKATCSRKTGRGACPCKAADLSCGSSCRCKQAKCKNKATAEADVASGQNVAAINPDGELQFYNELQSSATQIQEFTAALSMEDAQYLLQNLLAMGRGSLDFAKNLLTAKNAPTAPEDPDPTPGPSQNNTAPDWCKCKLCRTMQTEQENVCCKRVNCLTRFQVFNNICLDRDVLEICIKARCDIRADEFNFSMESFRKAAYRQFTIWRYGKLGRGNRRVVPSCAVLSIRRAYPSPDGRVMGFRSS